MIALRIPTPLRGHAGGAAELSVSGATLREALGELSRSHPALCERLLNEQGALRPYVNLFVNDEDARYLEGLDTPIKAGDRLAIVPAIAGGAC